ncbi:hypothetical protein [Methylocella sp.]|uniref:hypothetical protein n=1 Tax=Methylocella sp. TaxID=1978226 RepID=UPI0035B1CBC7
MKNSRKPFSVEIKRSRRSPAESLDLLPSEPRDSHVVASRLAARPGAGRAEPQRTQTPDDFAVPAFLQTEKRPADPRTDSHLQEAERLFRRAGAAPAAEAAAKPLVPRILPSLLPGENPSLPEALEPAARRRPGRPRRVPADAEAALAPAREAKRVKTSARPAQPVGEAPKPSARRKASEQKAASPRPEPKADPADSIVPPLSDAPSRRARRAMAEIAALPRGQQWKRRLHPRAWRP